MSEAAWVVHVEDDGAVREMVYQDLRRAVRVFRALARRGGHISDDPDEWADARALARADPSQGEPVLVFSGESLWTLWRVSGATEVER